MGLSELRPEQRRSTRAAFLTIFGTLAGHTLLETARDALFLARLPASHLAFVYFAIAIVAVAASQSPWGRRRASGPFGLSRLLGGGALVTFGFWLLLRGQHPAEIYALYVWTGLLGSLAVLQFWMVLGDLYTLGEAKRLYSRVWLGSLLGATTGAACARMLAQNAPASALVLAAAIVLGLTAVGPAMALGRAAARVSSRPRVTASLVDGLKVLRGDAYLRALAVLVLVSTIALTLADYVFKSAVARAVPPEELGAFFGGFYTVLNLLALVAQLVLAGWLFQAIGLHRALWVLPSLLFLGAAGLALGGGLVAALLLKGADGSLRNSLHRTGTELLFVPLKPGGAQPSQAARRHRRPARRTGDRVDPDPLREHAGARRRGACGRGCGDGARLGGARGRPQGALPRRLPRRAARGHAAAGDRPAARGPRLARDADRRAQQLGRPRGAGGDRPAAGRGPRAAGAGADPVPPVAGSRAARAAALRARGPDRLPAGRRPAAAALRPRDPRRGAARAHQRATRRRAAAALARRPEPARAGDGRGGLRGGGLRGRDGATGARRPGDSAGDETQVALARAIAAQPSPAFEGVLLRLAERGTSPTLVQVARAMGAARSPALPARAAGAARPARGEERRARRAAGIRGRGAGVPRAGALGRGAPAGAAPAPAAHDRALRAGRGRAGPANDG